MPDNDLGGIGLTVNARRVDKAAGARLANDPLTRLYLEAGLLLLSQELLEPANSDTLWEHPLRILSRNMIVKAAKSMREASATPPGDGSFRDRWPRQSDYVADLIRYSMLPLLWSGELQLADDSRAPLSTGVCFSEVAHEIARQETELVNNGTVAMRLHLVATALAGKYTTVLTALTDVYRMVTDRWQATYGAIFAARRITLRPGISMRELTMMLTALSEGLNKRYLGDSDATELLIDEQHKRTLLGKAALLLVAGAVDPGDGLTVEQQVDNLLGAPESSTD